MKFLKHKPPIQLIVFDLDGTLIDSKTDLALSVNATLEYLGRDPIDDQRIYSYVGSGAPALIAKALGEGISSSEVARGLEYFIYYYSQHKLDNTRLYPGVREALQHLSNGHKPDHKPHPHDSSRKHSRQRTMAVLSNKPVYPSREIIRGLGLGPLFPIIYGGNSFYSKKPDPEGLKTILEETRVSASAAIMVGDSDVDIQTGINAGVWTCGVTHGFGNLDLEANPPDLVVDNLLELARLLI